MVWKNIRGNGKEINMLDKDFIFGTASSAYQIEGGWNADGKCPSIWDEISHGNDKRFQVNAGHTGDIACNHYNEWMIDVELMKELGIHAYRFSISWSRICTQNNMCSNLKGIKFYQNLVEKLKENNIEPFVTLYHWDLPKWLDDIGGWGHKKSIECFRNYAFTMFNALPDVKYWITFNEPAVFINNHWGHNDRAQAIKNVLLAHGEAVKTYRKLKKDFPTVTEKGKIGISLNLMPITPYETSTSDEMAAENLDKMHNRVWLDPIYKGEFPKGLHVLYGYEKPFKLTKKESKTISQPIDFIGVNYYTSLTVKNNPDNPPSNVSVVKNKDRYTSADMMGVDIRPYGLYQICKILKDNYNDPEIYITENGCACEDTFVHDRRIHDFERIRYIREHLKYCHKAVKDGIKLKGYFYWSLMDNFEWLQGYNKRFGLLYIFYPTQSRVCKDSFYWYKKMIIDPEYRKKQLTPE